MNNESQEILELDELQDALKDSSKDVPQPSASLGEQGKY